MTTESQRLFYQDGALNLQEFYRRLRYWVNYGKTGATADVEKAQGILTLLCKIFERYLYSESRKVQK